MTRLFFSLQFRLTLAFAIVLLAALASVSWYVGNAAEREAPCSDKPLRASS